MEKEFIPYEQALELKELGFDEPCLSVRHRDGTLFSIVSSFTKEPQIEGFGYIKNSECLWEDDEDSINGIQEVATPTFSQAFRWFREKHGWVAEIHGSPQHNHFYANLLLQAKGEVGNSKICDTYEEAELSCLRKLIEIVKNKN